MNGRLSLMAKTTAVVAEQESECPGLGPGLTTVETTVNSHFPGV